jgi:septum formation protein
MRSLDISQIKKYLSTDNPIDCAGSYKLELNGISLFNKIETSDHTAIIGLPLIQLANDLNDLGHCIPPI